MYWFIIVVYLIVCFGISTILIDSTGPWHMFERWHNWMSKHTPVLEELFSCFICLPTWLGIFFSIINIIFFPAFGFTPFNLMLYGIAPWWFIIPLDAAFTSGGVWLIHTFQSAVERYSES